MLKRKYTKWPVLQSQVSGVRKSQDLCCLFRLYAFGCSTVPWSQSILASGCTSCISQSWFHTAGMLNANISLIIFIPFVPLTFLLLTTQILLRLKIINPLESFPSTFLHPQTRSEHLSRLSHFSHGGFPSTYSAADSLQDKAQPYSTASNSCSCLGGLDVGVSECITSQPANKYLDTTSSETYSH